MCVRVMLQPYKIQFLCTDTNWQGGHIHILSFLHFKQQKSHSCSAFRRVLLSLSPGWLMMETACILFAAALHNDSVGRGPKKKGKAIPEA